MIWSQTLTLPAAALAPLKDAELAAALAFEAEPLSGIPSTHAAMGFVAGTVRQDGMIDYAAIAMDLGARDEIQAIIRKAGGKLRGVCSLRRSARRVDRKTTSANGSNVAPPSFNARRRRLP